MLDAARDSGVTGLPSAATVSAGRVWPAGAEWVAEVGQAPDTHALDQLYPDQDRARAAACGAIEAERDRLAQRLRAAGGVLAELAGTRERWQEPALYVWDSADQREPRLHAPAYRA
ncbi:hypothetical protein ACNTMW_01610 [Planosporangium sp. 12N6]|uniref:hypothetical protein n=1 Tax=Planosporangium spinosum TaxID=3402278 RepID=UPI003CECE541